MVNIVIIGAAGRMGQALIRCSQRAQEICVVGTIEWTGCPCVGRDAGAVAGVADLGIKISTDLQACIPQADVLIDFSMHDAVPAHVELAAEHKKGIVIGTTGLDAAEKGRVVNAARHIPVVWAPNMSVGVNLLFALVKKAAAILDTSYDVEIVEMHHHFKKDAPSGTALRLGERVAEGRGQAFEKVAVYGREGLTGERPAGQIGIHAVRAGDIIGDHSVLFATEGERVEFNHRASSRDAFALGALRAARWVAGHAPGLFDMQDVLGLKS